MKKNIFLILTVLLSFCVTTTSCGDDDNASSSDLIGKWTMVSDIGYDNDLENPKYNQEWNDTYTKGQITIEFEEDGSFYEDDKYENYKSYGQWRIKGSKLYLTYDDEDDYEAAYTIAIMTTNQLILELYGKDQYYEHYSKTTWERID